MKTCPFVYCNGVLTVVVDGRQYQVRDEEPHSKTVKSMLRNMRDGKATKEDIKRIFTTNSDNLSLVSGKITVQDGNVYFNGEQVHNVVTERILQFMREGLPFEPLVLFLENLMQNPSYSSRQELYDFLQNRNLPITEDGYFLAYKAVRSDYMDKYTGKISNAVGRRVTMTRPDVDDNRNNHCSAGLHCGALDYVRQYGNGSTDKIVIVKVHPKDAVSVPTDHSYMKLRVCEYLVIEDFTDELQKPLYSSNVATGSQPVKAGGAWSEYEGDDWWEGDGIVSTEENCCAGNSNCCQQPVLGVKPNGQHFHNVRDNNGRFAKK